MNKENILILAPHTDDGEFGAGGTISKMIEDGKNVYYIAFSTCEESLPIGMPKDTLKKELMMATDVLGISKENVITLNYPVRDFPKYRQDILENMVGFSKDICPSLVLIPSLDDIHQDHQTIASEALRAFKKTSILGYELQWNNYSFRNQVFTKLDECHVDKKILATKCYESQKGRDYLNDDYIRGVMRSHGVQIGVKYAEVFECVRWII
jgi:LmbE family N-acetylglucosaminyl deacetylase